MSAGPNSVFISYARASNRSNAVLLQAALATRGIVAFRDERSLSDGEEFTAAIIDALLGARVLVALIDSTYFERLMCRWELTMALAPAISPNLGRGTRDLNYVVVGRAAGPEGNVSLERLPPDLRTTNWPLANETDRLVSLVERRLLGRTVSLRRRLGAGVARDLRFRMLEEAALPQPSRLSGIKTFPAKFPPTLHHLFVGRSEVMWQLDYLLRTRYGAEGGAGPVVALQAGGGFGKSRLALEYVYRYGKHFKDGIFWIDGEAGLGSLDEQLHAVVKVLHPASPDLLDLRKSGSDISSLLVRTFRQEVREGGRVLFVVDNLPEAASSELPSSIRKWCPIVGQVALLITSRLVTLEEGVEHITLDELSIEPAISVLTTGTDRGALPRAGWETIARWVGDLPLALVLLNRAVAAGAIPASKLHQLASAGQGPTEALDRQAIALQANAPSGIVRGVSNALALSFSLLDADAKALAVSIAQLGTDPVPEALLAYLPFGDLPIPRATLRSRSYVQPIAASAVEYFGQMHRVLADFIRTQPHEATAVTVVASALDQFLTATPGQAPSDWPLVRAAVPHIRAVANRVESSATDQSALDLLLRIRWRAAMALYWQGDYASASALQEEVLAAWRGSLGPIHQDTLMAANHLANSYQALGDFDSARRLEGEILSERRKILGLHHPDTIMTASNLGTVLNAQGKLRRAELLAKWVLAARTDLLGPDDPDTIVAANNLAAVLYNRGRYQAARTYFAQVVDARRRLLTPDHQDTLLAEDNLATVISAHGHYDTARALQESIVRRSRRLLGKTHPQTLNAAQNLGVTLSDMGELGRAKTLQQRTLAVRRRAGPEHPATLTALHNLGETLFALGDLKAARALQSDVSATRERLLGPKHPSTLNSRHSFARTLLELGEVDAARSIQENVLKARGEVLGEIHPDTLNTAHDLAISLRSQGEVDLAQSILERVLSLRAEVLGGDHPGTHAAVENLAKTPSSLPSPGSSTSHNT